MLRGSRQAFAVAVALLSCPAVASASEVPCPGERATALTFDDLPGQRSQRLSVERLENLTRGILAALSEAEAPAIGFVNVGKLYDGERLLRGRQTLVERWAVALDRGDSKLASRLDDAFVEYMLRTVAYYEGQSCALFERKIPQILLLHANALNGRSLGLLLKRLEEVGYSFVSLAQALRDPAFESPDTYVGPAGITWLHRWALTREVDWSIFAGEPTTPTWVQDLAGIDE